MVEGLEVRERVEGLEVRGRVWRLEGGVEGLR